MIYDGPLDERALAYLYHVLIPRDLCRLERSVEYRLSKRGKDIVTLRFGLVDRWPRTLDETAEILGTTREKVKAEERAALDFLRRVLPL